MYPCTHTRTRPPKKIEVPEPDYDNHPDRFHVSLALSIPSPPFTYLSLFFLSLVAAVGAAKAAAMDFSGALALLKNITDEVRHMKNGSGM